MGKGEEREVVAAPPLRNYIAKGRGTDAVIEMSR